MILSDFSIMQYKEIREEVLTNVAERRKIENYIILAIAIFYSWFFTQERVNLSGLSKYALLLPVFLSILGSMRWFGIQMKISFAAVYLRKLEEGVEVPSLGWETWIEERRVEHLVLGRAESWSEVVVWVILFVSTLFVAGSLWSSV